MSHVSSQSSYDPTEDCWVSEKLMRLFDKGASPRVMAEECQADVPPSSDSGMSAWKRRSKGCYVLE